MHVYAMVPSNMSLLLAVIPAILMALAIVREKELGSITNLYVTPVTRTEFLLGKQLPYIAVAMANFTLMLAFGAVRRSSVPLKGSFPTARCWVRWLYVTTMTGYRHADLECLHEDPDRRAVRHRHPDGSARNAIRRHDDAGFLTGCGRPDHRLADSR